MRLLPMITLVLMLFSFILTLQLGQKSGAPKAKVTEPIPISQVAAPSQKAGGEMPYVIAIFISVFVTFFVIVWCWMMFRGLGGQRLLNNIFFSKACYGLTDRRLIVVLGTKEIQVLSYHLRTMPDLRLHQQADGTGTIRIGQPMDRATNPFQTEILPPATLRNITHSASVFRRIAQVQDDLLQGKS